MRFQGIVLTAVLMVGAGVSVAEREPMDPYGKKTPPKAPMATLTEGTGAAVFAEVVQALNAEDTDLVVDFINKLYDLRSKYQSVLEKEVELRQSRQSNEDQKAMMQAYINLLNEEKSQAKAIINLLSRDLEAHESRLLQVMAKVHRVGDRLMKSTIINITNEMRRFVRFQLMNSQGQQRRFFVDAMKFLDQYFRG